MAKIGVQGLAAGEHQKHRAERQERRPAVGTEKLDRVERIDGPDHPRILRRAVQTQQRQHGEPQQHDRPEELPDTRGSTALDQEQADQDHACQRQNIRLEYRRGDGEPFHGAEHRDRRRDDPVAVQKRCAEHAEQDQPRARAGRKAADRRRQSRKRQNTTLAAVVGAQDKHDILDRHYKDQRPERQRKHAQYVGRRRRDRIVAVKRFAKCIQRRGTEIAVNHAECGQGEHEQLALTARSVWLRGRGADGRMRDGSCRLLLRRPLGRSSTLFFRDGH